MVPLVENIPPDAELFLNSINRGVLVKPSDLSSLMCCCLGCF